MIDRFLPHIDSGIAKVTWFELILILLDLMIQNSFADQRSDSGFVDILALVL